MNPYSKTVDDVSVTESLPPMTINITEKIIIMGAVSSRDWQPIHHHREWATEHAGLPNIIMNNYTQAAWISRYISDWSGPACRPGRIKFSMRRPLCPGDEAIFNAQVEAIVAEEDWSWLTIQVSISVLDEIATRGSVRLAVPNTPDSPSPWKCAPEYWTP